MYYSSQQAIRQQTAFPRSTEHIFTQRASHSEEVSPFSTGSSGNYKLADLSILAPQQSNYSSVSIDQRPKSLPKQRVDDPPISRLPGQNHLQLKRKKKGKRTKKPKRKRSGKQIVIYANGYPGYDSAEKEIKDAQSRLWYPGTPDFHQTAADTPSDRVFGASEVAHFFGPMQHSTSDIRRVVFIGHGGGEGIGLAGEAGVFDSASLSISDLSADSGWKYVMEKQIQPKLTPDATIDLYTCKLDPKDAFVQAMANSFDRCVRSFHTPLVWCLGYHAAENQITSRGRIAPNPPQGKTTNCASKNWYKGVNRLVPPKKVCPE